MRNRLFLFLLAALGAFGLSGPAAALTIQDYNAFYFEPGRDAGFPLAAPGMTSGTRIPWQIRNFQEVTVATGEAVVGADAAVTIRYRLPAGFYELMLPDQNQRIRLFGIAPFQGERDPYFGIDTGYSWFPAGAREPAMMRALYTHGIHTVRERLSYRELQEDLNAGTGWDAGQARRYLGVRERLHSNGLKVLDCFHDAPASTGARPGEWSSLNYPTDLVTLHRDWSAILTRFAPVINELEAWNEPDGFSRGPGSLYVPLVKTLAWSNRQSGAGVTLVGGVYSELASAEFHESTGLDRMLDVVDAISFHTYSGPLEVTGQLRDYRDFLRRYGRESLPIYITEGGRPYSSEAWWEQGNAACYIVAKGVVARACGLAQYYPFIAQSYGEGQMNFSMLDADGAPRRSLAAYLKMATELSGLEYLGNLRCDDPLVVAIPVFGNAGRLIAVPITMRVQAENTIAVDAPILSIEGIDGRTLTRTPDGRIPLPDGVGYLVLAPASMRGADATRLDTETEYMELYRRARLPLAPGHVTPVVLSFHPDMEQLLCHQSRTNGFFVNETAMAEFAFPVDVYNLSDTAVTLKPELALPPEAVALDPLPEALEVAADSVVRLQLRLDLTKAFAAQAALPIRLTVTGDGGELLDSIAPVLVREEARKTFRAPSRGESIRVDGVIDAAEWGRTPPIALGDGNFRAEARFAWSPTALYFAIAVHDSEHIQTANPDLCWQQDCIQMAVDPLNSRKSDGSQYEFGMSLADGVARWSRWIAPAGQAPVSDAAQLVIRRDDDAVVTVYEGMLPWADIAPATGEPNRRIGLTFCIHNIGPEGGKRVLEWTPGITSGGGKDPVLFGEIQLYDNKE